MNPLPGLDMITFQTAFKEDRPRDPFVERFPSCFAEYLSQLLVYDPSTRYSAVQCCSHPLFMDGSRTKLQAAAPPAPTATPAAASSPAPPGDLRAPATALAPAATQPEGQIAALVAAVLDDLAPPVRAPPANPPAPASAPTPADVARGPSPANPHRRRHLDDRCRMSLEGQFAMLVDRHGLWR